MNPAPLLAGQRVLVVGAGGIGRAIIDGVLSVGGQPVVGSRRPVSDQDAASPAEQVVIDLADEASIASALGEAGPVDHIVSTASASAGGAVTDLDAAAIQAAVAAKLSGPLLLAKHAAPLLPDHGSMTFFSGVVAWRPGAGQTVMAMTNGGLAHLGAALAVELAPRRVNVISPGIVDSGLWDGRPDRDAFFDRTARTLPARRIGRPEDVAGAVLHAMTNPFMTGSVLHVDGGGRWA